MKQLLFLLQICLVSIMSNAQTVAMQFDSYNILYIGIENPITVAASGINQNLITLTSSDVTVRGEKGHYTLTAKNAGTTDVTVWKKTGKSKVKIGRMVCRVKNFPSPTAILYGKNKGELPVDIAKKLIAPAAVLKDLEIGIEFDIKFSITQFTVMIIRDKKLVIIKTLKNPMGTRFTDDTETQQAIGQLQIGDQLILTNILCSGPDQIERELSPIALTISGAKE